MDMAMHNALKGLRQTAEELARQKKLGLRFACKAALKKTAKAR